MAHRRRTQRVSGQISHAQIKRSLHKHLAFYRTRLEDLINPSYENGIDYNTLIGAIMADIAGEDASPEEMQAARDEIIAVLDSLLPPTAEPPTTEERAEKEMPMTEEPATPDLATMVEEAVAQAVGDAVGEMVTVVLDEIESALGGEEEDPMPEMLPPSPPERRRRLVPLRPAKSQTPNKDQLRREMMAPPIQHRGVSPQRPTTRNAYPNAPVVSDMVDMKYDHMTAREMAAGYEIMESFRRTMPDKWKKPVSETYQRAMISKIAEEGARGMIRSDWVHNVMGAGFTRAQEVLRARPTRADQLMISTTAGYGAEWVGQLYSSDLWESVRQANNLLSLLAGKGMNEREIPQGYSSDTIPLEGADPQFFVAAQTSANDSTTGLPLPKIGSQSIGTGQRSLTVKKLGSVTTYTGEMEEDSLIPLVPELRRKIEVKTAEEMEFILLNGDTETDLPVSPFTSAPYNINYFHGTPAAVPAGDYNSYPSYVLMDGLLKLALVTNTAQRIAGTNVNEDLLIAMMKKLGHNGKYANDRTRCLFVFDNMSYWSLLGSPLFKQQDKTGSSSVVTGDVTKAYGIDIYQTAQMELAKSTNGMIDVETTANNAYGRIVLTRADRWTFGWKRRVETETQRYPRSDATEIVTWLRMGIAYAATDSAVVAYGLAV